MLVLTRNQANQLANICMGIGQVSLASIAIPFLLNEFEPALALLGALFAIAFWGVSLVLSR